LEKRLISERVIREDQESPVTDIERMTQSDIMLKQYIDKFEQKQINMYNGDEYGYDMKTEKPFGSPKVYNNKTMDDKEKKMYRNIYSNSPSDIMGRIDKHMKDLGFPNSFHIPEDISRNDFDKLKKDWERALTKSSVQNERDLTRIVRRVIRENITITDEDFPFPDDPNELNKFHVEEIFKVANSADEATEMIKDYYPDYYFEEQKDTGYGKTMAFMSPEGEEIAGKYIIGCCGGSGDFENMDRFRRSDDAFYEPRKRY
jgi:hypothetical protein